MLSDFSKRQQKAAISDILGNVHLKNKNASPTVVSDAFSENKKQENLADHL